MLVDEGDYRVSLFGVPSAECDGALNGSLTRLNQGLEKLVEC